MSEQNVVSVLRAGRDERADRAILAAWERTLDHVRQRRRRHLVRYQSLQQQAGCLVLAFVFVAASAVTALFLKTWWFVLCCRAAGALFLVVLLIRPVPRASWHRAAVNAYARIEHELMHGRGPRDAGGLLAIERRCQAIERAPRPWFAVTHRLPPADGSRTHGGPAAHVVAVESPT